MDTREKIRTTPEVRELLSSGMWCVVASRFDFLTNDIARWLRETAGGRQLLAVVIDEAGSILSAEARAALVAALRCVDAVIIAPSSWCENLRKSSLAPVVMDEDGDNRRAREVRQRIAR